MSNFALRLPDSLFERARILAERDNCSLNQLFAVAIAEKIATIDAEAFFAAANPGGMMRALNVAWKHNIKTAPMPGDEMPPIGQYSVQEPRATYVIPKVPRKASPKRGA
jgi:hypothetical protein